MGLKQKLNPVFINGMRVNLHRLLKWIRVTFASDVYRIHLINYSSMLMLIRWREQSFIKTELVSVFICVGQISVIMKEQIFWFKICDSLVPMSKKEYFVIWPVVPCRFALNNASNINHGLELQFWCNTLLFTTQYCCSIGKYISEMSKMCNMWLRSS